MGFCNVDVCINADDPYVPAQISGRALGIQADIAALVRELSS